MSDNSPTDAPRGFPITLPTDESSREILIKNLKHWATTTMDTFEGVLFEFQPSSRWRQIGYPLDPSTRTPKIVDTSPGTLPWTPWDYCAKGCTHFPPRSQRARPTVFDEDKTLVITLTEALQTGVGSASQVYKGRVHLTSIDVVVKLYQMSRVGDEKVLYGLLVSAARNGRNWCNVLQSFRTECSAYEHMKDIQGSHIPYVHGFFQITLPHDEPCIAVVMEYIPGPTLREYAAVNPNPSADILDAVGGSLANVTHAVSMKGISVIDCNADNFVITSNLEVVHLDFGWFIPVSKIHRFEKLETLVSILKAAGFDKTAVNQWIVRRLTDPNTTYIAAFDVPMSESARIWKRLGVRVAPVGGIEGERAKTPVPSK
ncbi:hypothetical protein EXIGLDRAFT_51205 [Exidia glandulosa HHB12029]|uniref:Protein kinase domain-containing protein n=1 Tax=Exidia glandulosa HHB12029 TaxID=1314781 RepID=A0A165IEE0_EXIGL|nr:hypothetical protein EXIGLDRAFT_51205 [Exidia glandulosa HHB12029]